MFVTHLDKNYLLWGKLFLISAAKNAPDEEVYISGANLSVKNVVWLMQFHPKVFIRNHIIKVPEHIEYRRYMQCRITQVLLEAYKRYEGQNKVIIGINADMLVLKTMDELYECIKGRDILLKFDKQHLDLREIQNGVIVFESGKPSVLPFLEHYNSMWDDGKVVYRDDQRQLLKSYVKFCGTLKFGSLPHDYVDGKFHKDSHIWSAHRHNRFTNYNIFLKELGFFPVKDCPNLSWINKSDGRKEAGC